MSAISIFDFDGFDDALLVDPFAAIITVSILLAIMITVAAWPMTTRASPVERLLRRRHFGV